MKSADVRLGLIWFIWWSVFFERQGVVIWKVMMMGLDTLGLFLGWNRNGSVLVAAGELINVLLMKWIGVHQKLYTFLLKFVYSTVSFFFLFFLFWVISYKVWEIYAYFLYLLVLVLCVCATPTKVWWWWSLIPRYFDGQKMLQRAAVEVFCFFFFF